MSDREFDVFTTLRSGDTDAVARAVVADPSRAKARDDAGVSLLMTALYMRERDLAAVLLEHIEELDAFEVAALGRLGDLEAIFDQSAAVLTRRSADGFTVLHLAAFFGHEDLVRWMIGRGAPVDAIAKNPSLVRPLHSAVAARSAPVVELLLGAGADPDAPQRGGWTALHAAAKHGDVAIVDLLLGSGARTDVKSDEGQTPTDLASAAGHTSVVERLGR